MKRYRRTPGFGELPARHALATAIGLALVATATAAFGEEPTGPQTDIVVTGAAMRQQSSSSKFTAPLIDTPKSVTVISQALIAETGSTTLVDALRTVPGITFNAGEGGQPAGDNLRIRGFDAYSDVFIDGVRDAGSQTRDVSRSSRSRSSKARARPTPAAARAAAR